jgi:hypothetical protein
MSSNTQFMEHRWGTRVQLDAPADIRTADGRVFRASVGNASLSGALIETSLRLPRLSRIAVRPVGTDGEWLEACIVRTDFRGYGVEWMEPGLRAISTLLAHRRDVPTSQARGDTGNPVSWQLLQRLKQQPESTP